MEEDTDTQAHGAVPIQAHRDAIAAETLNVRWANVAPNGDAHRETAKVEGQALEMALSKV